jgi:hypothetical protein
LSNQTELTHRLDGWSWVEKHSYHMVFDWGTSLLREARFTPLRTAALVPLVGVLTVAATWFGLYLTVIAKWAP